MKIKFNATHVGAFFAANFLIAKGETVKAAEKEASDWVFIF